MTPKPWQLRQNKKNAEIFTPSFLVREILKKIPERIWKSTDTTFCDLCAGSGSFAREIALKLREYGHSDKNIAERIWIFDINPKWINRAKHFQIGVYNIKHIYCEDSINYDFKDMKFDVIVGNPPYQNGKNKNRSAKIKTNDVLWTRFIVKAFRTLKENGIMSFITPSGWMSPTKDKGAAMSIFNDLFKKNNLLYVCKFTRQEMENYFPGVTFNSSTFSYFVLQKNNEYTKTEITYNNETHSQNIRNLNFIPFYPTKLSFSIIHKIVAKKVQNNLECFSFDLLTGTSENYSEKYSDEFKYNIFESTKKPHMFGAKKDLIYDKRKILIPRIGSYGVFKNNGNCGIKTQTCVYLLKEDENLNSIYSQINNNIFQFYVSSQKYTQYTEKLYMNSYPKISKNKVFTKEELYNYFEFTKEECEYIDSLAY